MLTGKYVIIVKKRICMTDIQGIHMAGIRNIRTTMVRTEENVTETVKNVSIPADEENIIMVMDTKHIMKKMRDRTAYVEIYQKIINFCHFCRFVYDW